MRRLTGKSVLGLVLAASAGTAAMAAEVVVSTIACDPAPRDAAIVISPVDDSPLNMEIAGRLADALRGAGYRTGDAGALELRYHTVEQGDVPAAKNRSLGRLDIGSSKGMSLNLNLWSSSKDSVIGGRRPQRQGGYGLHLIVAMELDRVADRGCVWRGEAAASLAGWQRAELAGRLIDILVGEIGGDAALKRLDID